MIPKKSKIKKLILPILFGLVISSFLVGSSVLALETGLGYGTFSGLGTQDLRVSVMNVIRAILGFLGVLAIAIVFYGGFVWMTAGGNAEKIETAKKILTNAVIGLVIIFTSFAIVSFVITQLISATGAGGGGIVAGSCDEPSDVGTVNGCYICTDFGTTYGWQVDCSINGCCPGTPQCGVTSITPSSPPNQPMNAVVRVRFNLPNITGVDEIQVVNATTGVPVGVSRTIVGNTVEIRPTDFCAAPQDSLNCFAANTTFNIVMNAGAIQCGTQNLVCGGLPDPCQGSFTTGDFVDVDGPTVDLIDRQICQGTTNELRALVNDDYGIDNVQFFDTTYGVLISTDTNVSVPPEGFATGNWDTSTYGINEFITVEAIASDYDSHVATDQLQFTIRAGHCCNAVQDADETGLNCGGNDCEACNPVIEWVSPLNGEEGNLITVHGRHFGDTPGTLTFLGAPNDGGADNQDGINPASVNAQCSNYWTDSEIVTVVSDAQDGPIMVRASNGTVDTTNELPGNNIADFDRNNIERPGICAVVPASGEPDDSVTIHGLRLDNGSEVYFSAVLAGGNPIGDGLMITGATVPNLDPAQVGLRTKNATEFSNPKTFSVLGTGQPGQFQCSSNPLSCSPDQSKCTPDKFCNSSCNCEPRQTCDTNTGTPTCEPSQGLCDPGWFCYNPQPDGPHQPDNNKLACHCYQAQFCDDPTQPADVQNPACHPNDGACPDNYTCDPNSNCTCQPASLIGDESAYGWFFQSGIKPGSCSNEAGICDPNNALCDNGETCNATTCNCEPVAQFACSSNPNVCSPDQDLCETGTFCNQTCQCETLVPCDADPDSPSCEPAACPQNYFCYNASTGDPGFDPKKLGCHCYPGILCDGDIGTPVCDPDNDFCPTDYECNPNSCFCEAQVKVSDSAAYTWFFNTTSFGPRIVESCNRSNTCDIDSYSSPSPYNVAGTRAGGYTVSGARPDDGAIPVDSIITGMFTTTMAEDSINETSVIVLRCNEAGQPFNPTACGAQQIIDDNGIDVHGCDYAGEQVTCFDFEPSALLTKNYWYQVTLNTSQIFGSNGVNLIGNSIDNNYRWVFKTRDSDELSRVACVYVEPTYQTAYSLGAEHEWNAYVSPEDFVCVLMNADRVCTWDWATSDGRASVTPQDVGDKATTVALAETLPDPPVDIIAQCTFDDGQKDGEGKLTIDLTSPYVIDKFPDCGTACLNARIGATFSRTMDNVSVTDALALYICYNDPNCEISPANEVTSFNKPIAPAPDEAPNTFIGDMPCFDVNDDGRYDYCLLPNTYYRVVINDTAVSANDNKPLAGLNFDDPTLDGLNGSDSYSWVFKTQADAGLCLPDRIDVSPADRLAPVDTLIDYASRPRTAGDACDPDFGQRLNPYIWSWDYDTNLISRQFDSPFCSGYEVANILNNTPQNYCTVRTPGSLRQSCGNNVIETGESCDDGNLVNVDGCSTACLHEGTIPPACGNGAIDAGEECETPGSNYCGSDCLWVGNTDYDLEVCGNGIIETSEMCEYPNTPGCGSTCLFSGTTAAAICGNGVIDNGEECDEAERLNGDAPSSGDYNGDGVNCSASCLIENRGVGICRSLSTNRFDFTQNSGSCNSGYVSVPLNIATGNDNVGSVCGNRVTELGEQCDLGGRCSDNNQPCTVSNLFNCANPATATCEPRDTYCFDPGNTTDGQTCPTPGAACGISGVCVANTCTVECLNAGYPSGFYPNNISPYQRATAVKDGETYIQSWIGGYSPVDTGPMGEGHLLVGDGGGNQFVIVERWPNCEKGSACVNADIGARFSKSADPDTVSDLDASNLTTDRIFLYECGLDYDCVINNLEPIEVSVDSYMEKIDDDAFRINLPLFYNLIDHDNNPSTPRVNALLPNTNYRVVVRNTVMSAEGLALTGLNFDDPHYDYQHPDNGSRLDSHSWVFRTQDTSEICSLDSVNVNPDDYFSESGAKIRYSSEPRSEPDVCDPRYGQRLNPFYYDWNWDDEEVTGNPTPPPTFLDAAEFAQPLRDGCGNALVQFGEDCDDGNLDNGDGCSSICLHEGTAAPTCGNGRIDRGEECEPGGAEYCGSNCLLLGNTNYTLISPAGYRLDDVCGNGVVEPSEECDEGNEPNGNEADGCNDYCRYSGAVPSALSICGDGQIGLGEECDDGDFADGSPVVSGDGCRGTDAIALCTGLDRTACTAFPAANACYWTGNTCKTRPCLLESKNVNICRSDRTGEFDFNQSATACEDGYDTYNLNTVSGNNNFDLPICGNRRIEEGEECDLGGRCSDNGQRCIPTDKSNCTNPDTAVCELALGICTSDGRTCNVIGSACGSGGTCFSTGCSAECLNAGAIEDSLLQDTLIDPYQVVETLSVPTVLAEVNEEIKAFATIQPNAVGVGLLHVVPGSQVDFAVIGHQPAIGAQEQCLNVGIWALFSRPLNTETLSVDSIRLCQGGDCNLIEDYSYRIVQGECGDDSFCHFPEHLSDVDSFGVCHNDFDCVGSQLVVRSLNTDTGFLDPDQNYEVRVDQNLLEDINGTTLAEANTCNGTTACEWGFSSGQDFCECEYISVSIDPTTGGSETIKDLFTCSSDDCGTGTVSPFDDDAANGNPATEQNLSGNQHLYNTVCYDIHNDQGGRIPLLPTGLRFEWAVFPNDDLIYLLDSDTTPDDFINDASFVTPNNANGDSDVFITAHEYHCGSTDVFCDPTDSACGDCTGSKAVNQTVRVTNFMCSNPWPGIEAFEDADTNCDDANNCYDTNFTMLYCRDQGQEGPQDDLPLLYTDPLVLGNNPASPSIKDFIFTFESTGVNRTVNQWTAAANTWGGGPTYQFTVNQTGNYAVKVDGYNYPTPGWGNSADLSNRVEPDPALFNSNVNYNGFNIDVYLKTGSCSGSVPKTGTAVLLPYDQNQPQSGTVSLGQLTEGENYCIEFRWTNDWCKCNPECLAGGGTLADQCDANFYFSGWQILAENASADAIGIRVLENPLHLSPTTWYQSGLCGGVAEFDSLCFSDADCLVPNDNGLIAYYPLDGVEADYSGNSLDGLKNNNNPYLPGKFGQAANFSGADQWIEVDNNSKLQITGELTVSAWVNLNEGISSSDPNERGLGIIASEYAWNSGSGTETGWSLGDDWGCNSSVGAPCPPSDQIYFSVYGPGGVTVRAYANNFAQSYLDQWVLVTGVFKPGEYVKIYINGEERASSPTTIQSIIYSANTPLRIGHRADNDYQGNWLGRIDEVKIYSRALSASEIAGLMKPNVLECVFNVPTRGNPQQITTDNYQAIAEGRTVYVGATNRRANALWSNIYLMSYNQGAANETVEIFNRLLDPEQLTGRWSFNANISNHRVCEIYGYFEDTKNICTGIGTSNFDHCATLGTPAACNADAVAYGCYWDEQFDVCLGKICEAIYCENDFECPNLSCNANKEKIVRDAERYGDLRDLQLALNRYGQNQDGYPTLGGGTYVPNTSFSQWPSWQQTLGADLGGRLYIDPINKFVGCSDHYCDESENGAIDSDERTFCLVGDVDACGSKPHLCLALDPDQEITCWDEISKEFSCPAQMFSYAYNAIGGGADYALYTSFEYDQVGSWRSLPGYFCDTNGNGSIQINQETIRCVVNDDCVTGACLPSAETDLYQLPLTSTDVECRELNFTLDAATIAGGVSPAECAARRCYGGSNDPAVDECNSGELSECPDQGAGTYCTGDADYDGICDVDVGTDNCNPFIDCKTSPRDCYNPDQRDSGGLPGKGDVCDITCGADTDSDGVCDSADTCRNVYNPANASCLDGHTNRTNGQCDYDLDSIGDACDPCTDLDRDGFWDKNTSANTCLFDNCPAGVVVSADRFGYCSGNLSIQCNPDGNGNQICAGAGAGSCVRQTGTLSTYNPYQEDYDGDGDQQGDGTLQHGGYICDFCVDFDGDDHGDYPFYTGSVFNTSLTLNQKQHFNHCQEAVFSNSWPGEPGYSPGGVHDIDICPAGPFGAECTDEFGIEVSCYNPSGESWQDLDGISHTGQKDFNLDGLGDICDEFRVGLVNCGDGITDAGGGEACDCGKYNLTSDPSSPIACSTINNQPCNPGYDSNVGNGINNCNWCYRCQEVKNEEAAYCGDDVVQSPQENCERGNAGCDNSCQNFEPAEYCDVNGYEPEPIHFNSPTGQTSHNFLNSTPTYFYIPECSITDSTQASFNIDIVGNLPDTAIIFVTDRSGSMAGQRMVDAKAAIIETINNFAASPFAAKLYIGLVSYASTFNADTGLGNLGDPVVVSSLISAVNGYNASGGTEPDKAVEEATSMLSGFSGNRIMIFMTDGDANGGGPSCRDDISPGFLDCHEVMYCDFDCPITDDDYRCFNTACQRCTGGRDFWGACNGWTTQAGYQCCENCADNDYVEYDCSAIIDSDIAKNSPNNIEIYGAAFTSDDGGFPANPTEVNETSSNCNGGSCSLSECNGGYCFGADGSNFRVIYQNIYQSIVDQLGYSFSVVVDGVMTTPIALEYQTPTGGSYPGQVINLPSNICTSGTVNPTYPGYTRHTLQLVGLPSGIQANFSGATVNYCETCDEDGDGVMDASCGGGDCDPANTSIPVAESIAAGNCDDSIDNNCNGLVDTADITCVDAGGGGTIQEGTGNCADGIDNDVDSRVDCADPGCVGKPGPNGTTCCQVGTDCTTFGTGQCNACSNNVCVAVTAVNGSNCEGTCSFCSNGTCINRETGDGRECPAGWACTGPAATAYCSPNVSAEICNQPGDEDGDGLADCADVEDCDGHTAPDGGICCTDNLDCGGTCQTCSPTAKRCVPYTGLNGGLCSGACTYCDDGSCVARSNGDGLECPVGQICSGLSCVDPGATNECTVPSSKSCPFQQGVCQGSQESCVAPGVWPGCDFQTYVNRAAATGKTYEAGFESLCTDAQDNDCDGFADGADPDCNTACNDNGVCDAGENCSSCPDECPCLPGQLCCGGATFSCEVPECNANINCDDSNPATTDVCQGAATCNATCIHTPITACINGDGFCPPTCNAANDNDCAPVAACNDSDGGNTVYATQGTVTDGAGGTVFAPRTDSCSGNTLTEYGCNGTNFTSSTYNCASVANTICLSGACVLQAGVNSCSDSDGGANHTSVGTVSGQVNSVAYSHTDQCASGTTLTEWTCSGNQAVSSSPAFDCTTLGVGYTCSNGRCVAPPPVFVNYYCNADGDSGVSSSVSINCQQGTVNCPPSGQGCVTAPGNDCNDSDNQIYSGAPETSCNGVNNDCDAQTDEDYVSVPSPTCGVGACQTTGLLVCQGGTINNTCTPLPPSTEVCGDSIDNDCNGVVDNGCVNECTPGAQISCGVLDPVNYKGVCAVPTITCNALGAWPRTECTAQKKVNEVSFCTDNLDNDCDGFADCQETTDCPAGNVCSGNCLAGATCNVSAGPTQFDWICNAQSNSFCGGTGNACGLCVEVSTGNFQCQSNASACSGFQCGVCQDQGGGVNFSCAPNPNACTAVCTTCNAATLSCVTVVNGQDTDGTNQCHDNVGCSGSSCSCSVAGICQNCDDNDRDGLCNQIDVCPYDPDNDLDSDGLCAVGCFSGPSRFGSLTNGYICDAVASNVLRDTCQGGSNQDSGGLGGVPDDCEINSCKVVFGAQDYLNIYINGKLVTGNLSLPQYVSGNPPADVIDNVFVSLDDYIVSGDNVIAIEAYVEKSRGSYPDYAQAYRQIRGAFARVTDPNCTTAGCGLCDASGLAGTALRTDPVSGSTNTPDLPLKCLVVNDTVSPAPTNWNKTGFSETGWSDSSNGSALITTPFQEIEERLWSEAYRTNPASPRYNSPKAIWTGGNYTSTSKIYCRYTFIK